MAITEEVELTNMCMICDGEGNVIVQDKEDSSWRGWNFPGGHVEPGESVTESVIREVFEETGLIVKKPSLCGIKEFPRRSDGKRYIVFLYRADVFSGELKDSDEGRVFWHPIDKLEKEKLAPTFDEMLKVFCDDSISEVFYRRTADEYKAIFY